MRRLLPLLLTQPRSKTDPAWEAALARADWAVAACRSGLGPAFFVFLRRHGFWNLVPPSHREILEEEYHENFICLVARESVLAQVIDLLKPLNKLPALLKGLAFSYELYPDPAARLAGDIDLMVDFESKQDVIRYLQSAGMEKLVDGAQQPRGRAESAWRRITGRDSVRDGCGDDGETVFLARVGDHDVPIEIHYRLINIRIGGKSERVFRTRAETVLDVRPLELPFGEVHVLAPMDAFLHALRHIALHHRLIGFRWHHDLALMLERWGAELEPGALRERCRALNSQKILNVELAILRELFGSLGSFSENQQSQSLGALPWEYPLYRHLAFAGTESPLRKLVRSFLAPTVSNP